MAKEITFQVSKRGGPSTECRFLAPESVDDPRWGEVVSNPQEDIHELALQNLVIKIQAGARNELEESGAEAAQAYVNQYKYGARQGGGFRRPTLNSTQVKELKFSKAQLEALRAAGVKLTSEQEEQMATAGAES